MITFNNDKNINKSLLHNSNQVAEFIKFCSCQFSENNDADSLKNVNLINVAFALAPVKLHPLFGNNMAKTTFPSYFNKILMKYQEQNADQTLNELFGSVSSIVWNLTDSSELFCKQLISCPGFPSNLIQLLKATNYDERNKHIVEAVISIINNIIRRESLRLTFNDFDIIEHITELEKTPGLSRSIRIICVVIVFYIVSKEQLKGVTLLADDIRDDVIELIDDASNKPDFIAEGFTVKELIDIITVICRDSETKNRASRNQTLNLALLRMLSKNCCPTNIIGLAHTIYSNKDFNTFRQNYIDKNGDTNRPIIDEFNRLMESTQ